MNCKVCRATESFYLFEETLNRNNVHTRIFICRNCNIIYNSSLDVNISEKKFDDFQKEIVSTYYKVNEEDINATKEEVHNKTPIIQFLLDNFPNVGRNSLIDIGTGSGTLAVSASKFFNKVYATDLDTSQVSKTIKILKTSNVKICSNFKDVNETFDVAILWHVMEHLYDPYQLIDDLKHKMSTNGMIYCQVPLYKKQYIEDCHLWFYNAAAIKNIKEIFSFKDYKVFFDCEREFMSFMFIL